MCTFVLSDLEPAGYASPSSLSLKGNQDKWYDERENLIVKAALFDGFIRWEDWKVEVIAAQLLPQLGIDALAQWPCRIDNEQGTLIFGSYSADYRKKGDRYLSFGRLLECAGLDQQFPQLATREKISTAVTVLSEYIGESTAAQFVADMCLADYIMGNTDRHTENYGILIRRDEANKVIGRRPAPLYDFGMGLFQNQKKGRCGDLADAIQSMQYSPFAIDLADAYACYWQSWHQRCGGLRVSLNGLDFPDQLSRDYLVHSLATLGVATME